MCKYNNIIMLFALFFCSYSLASAQLMITNPNTNQIHLRKDCENLPNCGTDLVELLSWLWETRNPSAIDPVLVDIGAGTFSAGSENGVGSYAFCRENGFVTFRGAGRENTTITGDGNAAIAVQNCNQLAFQDLTIDGTNAIFYGLFWNGEGSSTYSNVKLISNRIAWYDEFCGNGQKHYFTGSIITSVAGGQRTAYFSRCAETWFYGSEITAISGNSSKKVITIQNLGGEIHIYGSVIRAIAPVGAVITGPRSFPLTAVTTSNGGETHIHGTGIDTISVEDNEVVALSTSSGGSIHASQSSYVLKTGVGGTKTRLLNNGGTMLAPYLWETTSDVPPEITSIHGSDMIISTGTGNTHPHLLLYSDGCPSSKWYDTATNSCTP